MDSWVRTHHNHVCVDVRSSKGLAKMLDHNLKEHQWILQKKRQKVCEMCNKNNIELI